MFIIMLHPLPDKLVQFTYSVVDALGNVKTIKTNVRRTMLYRGARPKVPNKFIGYCQSPFNTLPLLNVKQQNAVGASVP